MTSLVEAIKGAYLVDGEVERIIFFRRGAQLALACAVKGVVDEQGGDFCAPDPFGVVVRDAGDRPRQLDDPLAALRRIGDGTYAHRRAVAEAVVGGHIVGHYPFAEPAAVAAAGIMPAYLAHGARAHVGERGIVALAAHERLGDGERHHRVVGEKAVFSEDLKVLGAMVVKFEARAGDVADNGSV